MEPPLLLMLSLLGVAGYIMAVDPCIPFPLEHSIDRDALLIREVMIDTFKDDPAKFMRPLFDAVWNAAGWSGSINYDQEGK